jgi:hypothetical protein
MKKMMLLIFFFAVLSCNSMQKQITASPELNLNHEMLQILDFSGGNNVPSDLRKGIPDQVAEQIGKLNLYQKIGRGESFESSPSLLMVGEIVQYEHEKLSGQNAVSGHMIVDVMFIDKQTGFLYAALNLYGPIDKEEISREIIDFIRKNHHVKYSTAQLR